MIPGSVYSFYIIVRMIICLIANDCAICGDAEHCLIALPK